MLRFLKSQIYLLPILLGFGLTLACGGGSGSNSSTPAPSISSFLPTSGQAGISVTITGSHLANTSLVFFGGTRAYTFTVNSDTEIVATVPDLALTGPVSIYAKANVASSTSFTVLTPWSPAGKLSDMREGHTATMLPNGKVLITGGQGFYGTLKTAELYDPSLNTFSLTGEMFYERSFHTATLLPNGKVLIAGAYYDNRDTAELYDPMTGNFAITGSLRTGRGLHCASILPNGKVLLAGGLNGANSLNTGELYDPSTELFSETGGPGGIGVPRSLSTATLLSNGQVLIIGGWIGTGNEFISSEACLYDYSTEDFTRIGNTVIEKYKHTATLLPNGKVIIAGGSDIWGGSYLNTEFYDPDTKSFFLGPLMILGRAGHTATLLKDGRVLIAGAANVSWGSYGGELFNPTTNNISGIASPFYSPPTDATSTLLSNGKVLLTGGWGEDHGTLYTPLE